MTGRISITQEFVRNANSRCPAQTYWIRNPGDRASLYQALQVFLNQGPRLGLAIRQWQ